MSSLCYVIKNWYILARLPLIKSKGIFGNNRPSDIPLAIIYPENLISAMFTGLSPELAGLIIEMAQGEYVWGSSPRILWHKVRALQVDQIGTIRRSI